MSLFSGAHRRGFRGSKKSAYGEMVVSLSSCYILNGTLQGHGLYWIKTVIKSKQLEIANIDWSGIELLYVDSLLNYERIKVFLRPSNLDSY